MNFSICLDQTTTPNFNVANLSTTGFSIYSNLDLNSPLVQNIPYTSLFESPLGTCPFNLTNIPEGTTYLIVVDQCNTSINVSSIFAPENINAGSITIDCCYAIINLNPTPLSICDECNLSFDTFSTSTVGQIIAGNLSSTCGAITDYTIGWYRNGNYSSPEFISGFGNAFLPYDNLHPLTVNQAVPCLAGNWEGIIHDIAIGGTIYSSIAGTANGVSLPFLSCFNTVVVDPLTCANGPVSSSISKYSHQFNYNSQAIGTTSSPVSLTYVLDASVKYFAYAFKAFNVWDEIEIKWISGNPSVTSNPSLYSQPIYLEKLQIGSDTPGAFPISSLPTFPGANTPETNYPSTTPPPTVDNVWPKKTSTPFYFQRVLTLTNLETSSNPAAPDYLEITISPNPTNNNTQWNAGFQCLTNFDCTNCFLENFPNNLPKISKIELAKIYGCDKQKIKLHISGCKPYETSDWAGVGLNNLNTPEANLINSFTSLNESIQNIPHPSSWINLTGNVACNNLTSPSSNINCSLPTSTTVTLNKTPNQIQLTFNNYDDYLHYKNDLINTFSVTNITSPVPCSSNLTGILPYYQYLKLYVPYQSPNVNCGDNSVIYTFGFHVNDYFDIQYTNDNNPSSTSWDITIPQTPMVNCFSNSSGCNSCYSSIQSFITDYNSNIVTSFSFTTNTGAKYIKPFSRKYATRYITGGLSGSYCNVGVSGRVEIPFYAINTIPFISSSQSPTGWVNLPSLGASLPCSLSFYPYAENFSAFYGGTYFGVFTRYQVRFPHLTSSFDYSLSTNDFEIYSQANNTSTGSINYSPNTFPLPCPDPLGTKIYSYIGGVATVYSSSYFVGGSPTLVIDP
jgi:hypothetical protein